MRFEACELFDAHQPCGAAGQHGQVPGGQGLVGGGQRLPADPRRLRLRQRVRRRAQVPRDAALPGGADLDQPHPVATWPSTCSACRGRSDGSAMRPLDGITVVALEHAIAAPFCTRQLADLGARVIKVERPGSGDFARAYDERVRGLASHFVWTNRSQGKPDARRQAPAGAATCWRSCSRSADVLVQNLAPGAAARLGLSYEALQRQHPAADRLRHLGLRRRRPVPRQEGLRPADPERGGLPVDHRHAGRAGEGGLLDRRHRRRHVRLQQHPRGADRSAAAPGAAAASTCRCSRAWSSG